MLGMEPVFRLKPVSEYQTISLYTEKKNSEEETPFHDKLIISIFHLEIFSSRETSKEPGEESIN